MHERELQRSTGNDLDHRPDRSVAPGRASRSGDLRAPSVPLVSGIIQRKASGGELDGSAADAVDTVSTSGGEELPSDLRERFESSLDTDLSDVRVHRDTTSESAANAVASRAFTIGDHIHFAPGEFDPTSSSGQHLIAHEVAHTVQQRGGGTKRQNKLQVSQPGDTLEVEADRAADAMIVGASATVSGGGRQIARKAKSKPKPKEAVTDPSVSIPEKTISVTLWGRKTSFTCKDGNVSGTLALTNIPAAEAKLVDFSHKMPVQWGPVGGMLVFIGKVSLSASASVVASGGTKEFEGPWANGNLGYEGSIKATGKVGFTATGRVEALAYAGAGYANINAGGYMQLKGEVSSAIVGGGRFEVSPGGDLLSGAMSLAANKEVVVSGSGGLTVGYEALITSGKLYEVELWGQPLFKTGIQVGVSHDFVSGTTTPIKAITPPTFYPLRLSPPKLVKKGLGDVAKRAGDAVKKDQMKRGNDLDNEECFQPEPEAAPCDSDTQTCLPDDSCDQDTQSCL